MRTKSSEAPVNIELLLIGNLGVGKSSLIRCFSDRKFLLENKANATVRVDLQVHKMGVNSRKIKLITWVCHMISITQ